MLKRLTLLLCLAASFGTQPASSGNPKIKARVATRPKTFCNPLNLSYRFMRIHGGNGIREAADPVVTFFKGRYYLFASKSSGYWHTTDFNHWTHVFISDACMPIEAYAPATFVHGDYIYYVGSSGGSAMLYRSSEPENGIWEKVKTIESFWDPAFLAEDGKLYLYFGSSSRTPIRLRTFNLETLAPESDIIDGPNSLTEEHGWERPGEKNELDQRPYLEGAWMTKHNGKYYLQYAAPGTQWDTYADGVYQSDSPTGPFRYMQNSPVSHKPSGFIGGAGHGCLFTVGPAYWKAATNAISVRHMFERRLSFFPAGFDTDGYLYTDTYLGDYPLYLPGSPEQEKGIRRPSWMLLSHNKPVTVSSSLPGYPASNLTDGKIRTVWVAESYGKDEWAQIDLGSECSVSAIQVNYDEYGANQQGYNSSLYESYRIYASNDASDWSLVVDKSDKRTDTPHDYIEFEKPFKARYIKWANVFYTPSNNVSLRELRIFGKGNSPRAKRVDRFRLSRHASDPCKIRIEWPASAHAEGYIVNYGIAPDKLYNQYQVTDSTHLEINSLNSKTPYYFRIDTYNDSGITRGRKLLGTD